MNKLIKIFSFLASFALVLATVSTMATSAQAAVLPWKTLISAPADGKVIEVELSQGTDSLDTQGKYTLTFDAKRGPSNTYTGEIKLLVAMERDRCVEGNGQSKAQSVRYPVPWDGQMCFTPFDPDDYKLVVLNEANSFTQTVSTTTTQAGNVSCGGFQTDTWVLAINGIDTFNINGVSNTQLVHRIAPYVLKYEGKEYPNAPLGTPASSIYTGKDVATCQPTPTPTPSATPVAGQTQTQTQTQNNNQTVNVTVPQVAGVKAPTKLPETGVGVLGLFTMFSAAPLGVLLTRYGRGRMFTAKREEDLSEVASELVSERKQLK